MGDGWIDVTARAFAPVGDFRRIASPRAVVAADLDRDGGTDLVATDETGAVHVWRSGVTARHPSVRVVLTGRASNHGGVGAIGQLFGRLTTGADERVINAGVDESTAGAQGFGRVMSRWHSGQIQTYLGAVALGTLALILLYAWLG